MKVRSSEQVAPNEFDLFHIASREKPVIYEWIYMSSFPVWDKSSVPQFSHQGKLVDVEALSTHLHGKNICGMTGPCY